MEKIKIWVRDFLQRRSKMKAYGEKQFRHLLLVMSFLLLLGLLIEYFYYSTLGHLGQPIALEILNDRFIKLVTITLVVIGLDFISATIKGMRLKSVKDFFIQMSRRPALPFSFIYVLLLSFDIPISSLLFGTIVITLCCQNTRIGYSYYAIHPVLIGYLVGIISLFFSYSKFGLFGTPLVLTAPYVDVMGGPISLTLEQFNIKYYSLQTVLFGLYESSLSFMLIIPVIFSGLFLIKRKIIDYKVSFTYLGIYVLLSLSYHQGATYEPWVFALQMLNGTVITIAFFIITDVVTLPSRTFYKYLYVSLVALLTFICAYFIHFVYGPLLAIGVSQIIMFVTHLISTTFSPTLKLQFNKKEA